MSPITDYLHSSLILFSHSPAYDDKGRQLPFDESSVQRRERLAFVKSLQWQSNVATWMQNQQSSQSPHSQSPTHSPSSSESSSPHTPASPLNTLDIHTPQQHLPQAALDVELSKLALAAYAARSVSPPQHRQCRNYKNLHLANTSYTPRTQPRTSLQSKPQVSNPTRGIFDSSSYTYPSLLSYPSTEDDDSQIDNEEPYLFYSSSTAPKRSSTVTTSTAAGIGEFPMPISRSSALPITPQAQSPFSRTLTFSKQPPPTSLPSRIGDH